MRAECRCLGQTLLKSEDGEGGGDEEEALGLLILGGASGSQQSVGKARLKERAGIISGDFGVLRNCRDKKERDGEASRCQALEEEMLGPLRHI